MLVIFIYLFLYFLCMCYYQFLPLSFTFTLHRPAWDKSTFPLPADTGIHFVSRGRRRDTGLGRGIHLVPAFCLGPLAGGRQAAEHPVALTSRGFQQHYHPGHDVFLRAASCSTSEVHTSGNFSLIQWAKAALPPSRCGCQLWEGSVFLISSFLGFSVSVLERVAASSSTIPLFFGIIFPFCR